MTNAAAREPRLFAYLSLFTSLGTLVCCALPSLLVLAGLGATVASVLSVVPWLAQLSRRKPWVFMVAGTLIAANAVYVYRIAPRLRFQREPCAGADQSTCASADRVARTLLWISAGIYGIGFLTAYILGTLLLRFA
jgi:mercuric ion transport protein